MTKTLPVLSFAKLEAGMPMPHLLDIQTRAFQSLLEPDGAGAERSDIGLERVFKDVFPIQDVNGNYSLEVVKYALGEPKYSVEECIERDMTYSVPLKATLQLVVMEEVGLEKKTKRPKNIIEKEVYLGELPILTPLGTFVINGAERVIVSQLHRSPGVVFEESIHPNGQRLFSARIIPFRGSWVEFTIDIHDVIFVHIDKKKKFPATALLRAFGYGDNADILKLFYALKDIDITGKLEGRAQKREVLGTLLAADVPDPENKKGEPLARVGDELTLERFNTFRRAGITAVKVFAAFFDAIMRLIGWIIWLLPIGVFLLVSWTVGKAGLGAIAGSMGKFMLLVIAGLAIHGLVVLPISTVGVSATLMANRLQRNHSHWSSLTIGSAALCAGGGARSRAARRIRAHPRKPPALLPDRHGAEESDAS